LQRFLLFEGNHERGGVQEDLLPDLEDILDDLDGVAGLQPQVLLGTVKNELVGEGGKRDLTDRVDGDSAFKMTAVQQV
jgi:hypothetical protein